MGIIEIILIGIGLSMDAVAVSMTNGMVYKTMSRNTTMLQPIYFGMFQGIMPLLGGFLSGSILAEAISSYSGYIILVILGIIGIKMVKDGYKSQKDEACVRPNMSNRLLIAQAFATSVDAFAVGIGLSLLDVNLLYAASIISITTFILVIVSIRIGKKFGDYLGCKAEMLGGVILISIGLKAFLG